MSQHEFIRDIPTTFDADSNKLDTNDWYYITQDKVKNLGLNSLVNGTKGIEIRWWTEHFYPTYSDLLVLRFRDKVPYASRYMIESDTVAWHNDTTAPKNGWKSFIGKLSRVPVMTLNDPSNNLKMLWLQLNGPTHPGFISVEVATPHMYRLYTLRTPVSRIYGECRCQEARDMESIMNLLYCEFPPMISTTRGYIEIPARYMDRSGCN